MKRLLMAVCLFFIPALDLCASALNYNRIIGGGIIADYETVNPLNPANLQNATNFFQLELFSTTAAPGVTDPTGSPNVMFAFPLVLAYRFNSLAAFRLTLFDRVEYYQTTFSNVLNTFNTPHAKTFTLFNPAGISYALRLFDTLCLGLSYNPEMGFLGTYRDDGFSALYFNSRMVFGASYKWDRFVFNAMLPVNLTIAGAKEAATNGTYSHTLSQSSPLGLAGLNLQANMKMMEILTMAARLEGGIKLDGVNNQGPGGLDVYDVSSMGGSFFAGMKLSPVTSFDMYLDAGLRLYMQNVGTSLSNNAVSTRYSSLQTSLPCMRMGVGYRFSDFRFTIGLTQDIIGTTADTNVLVRGIGSPYAISETALTGTFDGNTVYSISRTASMGISYSKGFIVAESILDISTTGFLGEEIRNPFYALASIFNSATGGPAALLTGVRLSVLF